MLFYFGTNLRTISFTVILCQPLTFIYCLLLRFLPVTSGNSPVVFFMTLTHKHSHLHILRASQTYAVSKTNPHYNFSNHSSVTVWAPFSLSNLSRWYTHPLCLPRCGLRDPPVFLCHLPHQLVTEYYECFCLNTSISAPSFASIAAWTQIFILLLWFRFFIISHL